MVVSIITANLGRTQQRNMVPRVPTITATDRYRAMQRAKDFRSENPFFVVLLQPSYATGKYLVIFTLVFIFFLNETALDCGL